MDKKLSAILVDDERLARKDLRLMLNEFKTIEIIGEADHSATAISLIEQTDPDLIFLDIQMPGESGFEMLEKVKTRAKIIFVTAFDEYAIRAFEVNALDYLLKPVSPARLKATIDRLFEKPEEPPVVRKRLTRDDRLFILFGSGYKFIRINTILYIASSGDYSEVHLSDGLRGLTNRSMQEWEERLPESTFCRIHRSTIINLDFVIKVEEWFNSTFRVSIQGVKEPFIMSRRYASHIKAKMG
ncbi:MAG: LytTR family DNA-binding domain-containing protein [Bacteroidia bacterium]|nr:LytTR family DNA-binding domain-containing protein [Bacteroidia bacterium]